MRALKLQFFLSYAIVGSLAPLLSVYLRDEKGFDKTQIGLALSGTAIASLFSPLLMTLLADLRVDARRILAGSYAATAAILICLNFTSGFFVTSVALAIYGVSIVAMFPLQDGFFFSAKRRADSAGDPAPAYPAVRVWGTAGFILPSVALWYALEFGANTSAITYCGAAFAVLSLANSFALPRVILPPPPALPDTSGSWFRRAFAPTTAALRLLFSPKCRILCLSIALAAGSSTVYHNFFGPYATEILHIEDKWVGIIMNVGVVLEIGYTLALPWLLNRLGAKGVVALGFAAMSARMAILALFPSAFNCVATQISHGIEIMAIFVVPVMIFDRLSADSFRNSVQGAFSMLIASFRFVGSMLAGAIAQIDLLVAFGYGSVLALSACILILLFFREPDPAS